MSDTALEYLAGSSVRPATLAALRDHDRLSIRELDDRMSASRRTLKRTLNAMESRGWVRSIGGTYEFTALGGTILDTYEEFRDHERLADRLQPFLEHAPAATFDLGLDALADADVVAPDDDPGAFADRLVDLRAAATRVREYAPFLLIDSVRQLSAQAKNGESTPEVTLVLGTDLPPQSSPEYADRFETLTAAPNIDVRLNSDGPPLGIGIADDRAFLGTANGRGMPHALLVSDASEVVDWAERQFESCLSAAEPISPD